MAESYSGREAAGEGGGGGGGRATGSVAEPAPVLGADDARVLLAQLLPGADADLLVAGLLAERERGGAPLEAARESALPAPERELRRVRAQIALGAAARTVQHAINNPLTALLAEAQLLELDELTGDQRAAVGRMVALARRLVEISRRLDVSVSSGSVG